jgi:beta-lactamase regulating signal transducer with metallopeptidase domain
MASFWIELFLRGLTLWLLASIALASLRRAAAACRHQICVLALSWLGLLPLTQRLLPPLPLLMSPTAFMPRSVVTPTAPISRNAEGAPKEAPQPPMDRATPATPATPDRVPVPGRAIPAASPSSSQGFKMAGRLLAVAWGIGALTLLIRLLVALWRLRALEADSRPATVCDVQVRISERIATPLTWGLRRSVILLPAALLAGDRAVCESALRHEQAHIARHDWLWSLLAELVCACCWFQPAAWRLRARMRLESERACDDRVLLSGVASPDYAAHLLQIVRSIRSSEIAPAMAQSGELEERMRHILDAAKPRHASPQWLVAAAPLALALLSLPALRVSARPAEAKPQTGQGAAVVNSDPPQAPAAAPAAPAATPATQTKGERAGRIAADVPQSETAPAIPLDAVTWGKAVGGLEPGFLLTTPNPSASRRVPLNSRVAYRVLVRNVTRKELSIGLWLGGANPWRYSPYLIPNDELRDALRSRVLPERFEARGVTELSEARPAYLVKLAPGAAVMLPGELGLGIGNGELLQEANKGAGNQASQDADKLGFPRIDATKAGLNWIVQPVTVHMLSAEEQNEFQIIMGTPYSSKIALTFVDRNGRPVQRSVPLIGAGSGGTQLYARAQIEIVP